jgi:alpha-beta hydrolase superfamily lysophospholipase
MLFGLAALVIRFTGLGPNHSVPPPRSQSHRLLHFAARLYFVVSVILAVTLAGGGWYYSNQLLPVAPDTPSYDLTVLAVSPGSVTLNRTSDSLRPGTYALQWHGGRAVMTTILKRPGSSVTRRLTGSTPTLRPGIKAHVDIYMYSSPGALHLPFRSVAIPGPLGRMPAWFIPGKRTTWALMVHGLRESRTEGLRPVPTLSSLGLPVLDLTYRNDVGAPASPDHLYHLGATEWQDLEAAVRYALTHGAREVILYGYSMGGTTVEMFLHRSAYAGYVRAVVLDAPVLNWADVLSLAAEQRHLPGLLTSAAERVVALRLGLTSMDVVNQVRTAASLRSPILLFHGTADDRAPFGVSVAFARARPDLVTFVPVAGAAHTEEWNANPALYVRALRSFLTKVLA